MARKYTKAEGLTAVIRARKAAGETNRAIGESYGLSLKQVKGLISRQNRKERLLAAGYVPRPKGRPRKEAASEEVRQHNELVKLRMQMEIAAKFSVRSWKEVKLKYRVIERFRGKYSVEAMGEVFEVSRSGYYAWRKRQERVSKDQWLAELIVECQKKCRQTYGIRRVRR